MIWHLTSSAVLIQNKLEACIISLQFLVMLFAQFVLSHPFLGAVAPEEPSEGKIICRRGRFQVTSDSISQRVLNYLMEEPQLTSIINCLLHFLFLLYPLVLENITQLLSSRPWAAWSLRLILTNLIYNCSSSEINVLNNLLLNILYCASVFPNFWKNLYTLNVLFQTIVQYLTYPYPVQNKRLCNIGCFSLFLFSICQYSLKMLLLLSI